MACRRLSDFLLAHGGIGHEEIAKEIALLLLQEHDFLDFRNRVETIMQRYDESCSLIFPLAQVMQKYINTPWITLPDGSKKPSKNIDNVEEIQPQAHAGRNVLAHSFWAAAQIYEWYQQGSPFIDLDIDVREAMIGAFCHDIAKASHCMMTCTDDDEDKCWYDPYHSQVYQGKGSWYHPIVSGDILLNRSTINVFEWDCFPDKKQKNKKNKKNEKINLPDDWFSSLNVDRRILALMGYMHWELGRVNLEKSKTALKDYLDKFEHFSALCGLKPTVQNLKKCILVSLADIRGSFPPEMCDQERNCEKLRQHLQRHYVPLLSDIVGRFGTRLNTDAYYPSSRPWFSYEMDKHAEGLRNLLLAHAYYRGFARY